MGYVAAVLVLFAVMLVSLFATSILGLGAWRDIEQASPREGSKAVRVGAVIAAALFIASAIGLRYLLY